VTVVPLALWAASTAVALALAAAQWRARTVGLLGVRRACHELRGPITAARLGLQLGARTGELSAASLRALDLELGRAGLALDDLVHPAGLELLPRREETVEAAALVRSSVLAWRGTAELHGVQLREEWAGPPAAVRGDRLRLAQVTGNLIANAIEHGGGEIVVRGSAPAGAVRIEVRDAGPGLPPAVVRSLDPSRGRGAGRLRAPGGGAGWLRAAGGRAAGAVGSLPGRAARRGDPAHGHGLGIAARIVALHRGRLFADPRPHGACVVVELPAVR
jgi:signal transduction histidine kinase